MDLNLEIENLKKDQSVSSNSTEADRTFHYAIGP